MVIQSAWDDELGNVGVYAVNTQKSAASLMVQSPDESQWRAVFYTGSAAQVERDISAGEQVSWRLEPGRLQAVVFERRE